MKKTLTTIMVFGLIITQAQNVGINTDVPKAALDVAARLAGAEAITAVDGIIPATMTGNQLAAKTRYRTDQKGVIVYITQAVTAQGSTPIPARATNLTAPGLYTWNGTAWQKVGVANLYSTDDTLSSDRIVNMGNHSLSFSNDIKIGEGNHAITVGKGATTSNYAQSSNTASGSQALYRNTTGNYNTASGYNALYHNTTGRENTAIGYKALFRNTSGHWNTASGNYALYSNTTGEYNTASGHAALYSNTRGNNNTASGYYALYSNTRGNNNTASGYKALFYNNTGNKNTASGYQALRYNTRGKNNTASGYNALESNTTGNNNTASGYQALRRNTSGNNNTASGDMALVINTTGSNNTASGYYALESNTTGNFNTASGYQALVSNTTGSLNTACGSWALSLQIKGNYNIGIGAYVKLPDPKGSNQIQIGRRTKVNYAGVGKAWTITSDRRFKGAIRDIAKTSALSLISKLRPVEYARREVDYHKEKKAGVSPFTISNRLDSKTEFGFIAQEVEEALQSSDYSSSGIITVGDDGYYGVRHNDFIPVLTKVIQEQQIQLEAQELKIDAKQQEINELKALVEQLINKKYNHKKL